MRLQGRRILITGAASGIGLATAARFAAEGAKVAMLDRNEGQLATQSARLGLVAVTADVADEASVQAAVAQAVRDLGGLDGVVNAAGVDLLRPFAETTAADWRRVMAVDIDGPFHICAAALPAMRAAGRGTIVNIASGAGLRPIENRTAYCSAKAALVMFSKALAMDLTADHIRVNAICPGFIDTPMARGSYEQAPDPEAELRKIMDRYVIKRAGQPDDIANAALFLTCDESAYVTGTAMAVDGGRTFH